MAVQQIARGVYRISFPPPTDKPARGAQYRSNFSQEKHKQWKLALEQAKMEIKDVQARNKFAREAANDARERIDKEIAAIRKQASSIRSDQVRSQEAANEFNSRQTQGRREFNASQRAQTERAQAQLDLSRQRAAATSAKSAAKAGVSSDYRDSADAMMAGAGGNVDVAWKGMQSGAKSGVIQGGDEALDQMGFVTFDRTNQSRIDEAVASKGAPLSAAEEAQITAQTKADMPADLVARHDSHLAKHGQVPGAGGVAGEPATLQTHGVGAPGAVSPVSRQGELESLRDRLRELQGQRAGITAEQRDVPNLIRTAQERQYESFGPMGFGRKAPGFQQQDLLRNVEAFMDTAIADEVQKLGSDATAGEVQLAKTRGVQNAVRLLGGTQRTAPEAQAAPALAPRTPSVREGIEAEEDAAARTEPVVKRTPRQREAAFKVDVTREANRTYNQWKNDPAVYDQMFNPDEPFSAPELNQTIMGLYNANQHQGDAGVSFKELWEQVAAEYADDDDKRKDALHLLLTYNMIQQEKATPKKGE